MFDIIDIVENIYEGVVETSYKNIYTRSESTPAGHSRKIRVRTMFLNINTDMSMELFT